MQRHRSSRFLLFALFSLIASLLATVAVPSVASAASTVGDFEIDGNLADDSGPGEPIDWATPPPNLTTFDDVSGRGDDIFSGGSKELAPDEWECTTGKAPGKDDLLGGQVAFRTLDGTQYTYVNYTRAAVNGDAHIDYEFHKSSEPNPLCPDTPMRSVGDVIISFDTEQGGAIINVFAYRWNGSTFDEIPTGSQGVTWDGAVNIPPSLTIPGLKDGAFGEAALNVTDTIGTIECGDFAGVYMKTRASTSLNASLKDRTTSKPFQLGTCPDVARSKSASPNPASVGDVVTYSITYTNTGGAPKTYASIVDDYDQGHLTVDDDTISNGGVDNDDMIMWSDITVPANGSVVLSYEGTVTGTFSGGSGSCSPGQFPVRNTVTDDDGTFGNTLCVNAAPNVTRVKVASPNPANVGQEVVYTITYTNSGAVAKTFESIVDDYDEAHIVVDGATIDPAGDDNGDTITWTNITVPANGQVDLTYQGTVTGTFSGEPGGGPCTTSQFQVLNTVTDSQGTFDETLCVNAAPDVTRVKSVRPNPADVGQEVLYTITYTNSGAVAKTFESIVDDYDEAHIVVDGATIDPAGDDNGDTITWTNITVPANGSVELSYQGTVTGTFGPDGSGVAPCATGQFQVVNTVTDSQGTFDETLCVNAAPSVTREKSADPNPADVDDVVTYTITYTNTGAAAKTFESIVDDYDEAHIVVDGATIDPAGDDNGDTITWTNITVPANGQVDLTYQGTVTGPFTGEPGGGPCTDTEFQVLNTVTDSQGTITNTLCVTGPVILTISKTACPSPAVPGGVLTYTITFSNTGQSAATGVTVTDSWPEGTPVTVLSTDGGTQDGNSVTWDSANIGTLDPGETDTRTLQVHVEALSGTSLQDTATITATGATSATTGTVMVDVSNEGAVTQGMAYGADADVLVLNLINELGRVDTAAEPSSPDDAKSNTVLPLGVPGILSLGLINTASVSSVTDAAATTTSSASVANINLLGGAITADVVKGVSKSTATPFGASGSSEGSTITGLRINGTPIVNVVPGATFKVKGLLGLQTVASVTVLEETKSATLTNGVFTAAHSVNMLHVTVLKPLLGLAKGAEIIVSHAQSDAAYPSGFACGDSTGLVSGKAFTAYVDGTLGGTDFLDVEVGNAEISPLGGSASNGDVVDITGVVTNGTTVNTTSGSLTPNPSATARSLTEGVNLLNGLITADVLDVSSTSTTTATTATTTFTRTFTNLRIGGTTFLDVDVTPNTVITVDAGPIGKVIVILDERLVAGNGVTDTEGTINAIHVYVIGLGGLVTAEVIVASAHSDAHHA